MGNSYAGGEVHLTLLSTKKSAQHFKKIKRCFVMSSHSTWEVHYV